MTYKELYDNYCDGCMDSTYVGACALCEYYSEYLKTKDNVRTR